MRGTSSAGFLFEGSAGSEQILDQPYSEIHGQTMTPVAHLLWSSLWAGVAASAVEAARRRLRAQARSGAPPFQMAAYTRAAAALRALRALTTGALERFEAICDDPSRIGALDQQHGFAALKVDTSRLAVEATLNALQACGLGGYRTDGEASVARQVRDILSAPLMINNERILADGALASLMTATPLELFDPAASPRRPL
jgi:acyl-CoA dehydrogenase